MRLICYSTTGAPPRIIPAPVDRAWMDQTPDAHAYRCLPLNIANAHGWMILNTVPFIAEWNGAATLSAVSVRPLSDIEPVLAESHFGSGVLTFHVKGLFRTEPGYDLMVTGPMNMLKDAIQPLSGIVETDWAPFTFTMNWRFTRPGTPIRFERDEPFCMIYPIKRGLIDDIEPEIRPIESNAEINGVFTAWANGRRSFNQELKVPGSEARAKKWQKDYFRGDSPFAEGPPDHRTKLRPKPFTIIRQWRPGSLLDQLVHEQTDANRSGRLRLHDGRLTPTRETVWVTAETEIDRDALDFVCIPNFLTEAERALLAEAARAMTAPVSVTADVAGVGSPGADTSASGTSEPVGDDLTHQVAVFRDIERERPGAATLLLDVQRRITEELASFYELTLPVFTDSMHLIRLAEGMWLNPHATRANADGSPHEMEHRDFASFIFLNDDHEGGDIYFPRLDFAVRPGAGMLLAFTAGWHHEHGVTEVLKGDQFTVTSFHTFNSRLRDPALMARLEGPPAR